MYIIPDPLHTINSVKNLGADKPATLIGASGGKV